MDRMIERGRSRLRLALPTGRAENAKRNIPKSEGVRTTRWKYIRYFEQNPVHEELYDLESDLHESRNLARDPEFAAQLAEMRLRCKELSKRLRAGGSTDLKLLCRTAERVSGRINAAQIGCTIVETLPRSATCVDS